MFGKVTIGNQVTGMMLQVRDYFEVKTEDFRQRLYKSKVKWLGDESWWLEELAYGVGRPYVVGEWLGREGGWGWLVEHGFLQVLTKITKL